MTNCDLPTATKARDKYRHLNKLYQRQVVIGPADTEKLPLFLACVYDRPESHCLRVMVPDGPYTVWIVEHSKQGKMTYKSLANHLGRKK